MHSIFQEYLPHAPNLGLHVAPDIPRKLLENARDDYAPSISVEDVVALYDATLLGSAKDGVVFLRDRCVIQNNDLESPQVIRYDDIVGVEARSKWFGLGGAQVAVDVNQGRATVTHTIDCSGKKAAAPYITRALQEVMLRAGRMSVRTDRGGDEGSATDPAAVRSALEKLVDDGRLSADDFERIMELL